MFYAHVSTPLSTVHCRVHTFLLIFLHPLLSVRGSYSEVTFDKPFLSSIYLSIIKVCPPQTSSHNQINISQGNCRHLMLSRNCSSKCHNCQYSKKHFSTILLSGKTIIAPIMLVHPFSLPPRFGRIKEHEIEYLTHTTDPEIDFGHQMAPLGTVLNFTSVCTTSWTDSLSDIGTHRSDPRFTWVQ